MRVGRNLDCQRLDNRQVGLELFKQAEIIIYPLALFGVAQIG